jgi:capsular exopolysaccharide synthesis family protein
MTQTFDPFSEVPPDRTSGVPGDLRLGSATAAGGRWTPPEEGLLEKTTRLVRRRKWIILQAVVIVTLVAFLYSKHQTTQYTASAGLLFGNPTQNVLPTGTSATASELNPTGVAATNSALVSMPAVATFASQQTGGKISPAVIRGAVSVSTSSTGSSVATISAVTGSPQLSARIANAYGRGYIQFRKTADTAAYAASIARITDEYNALSPSDQSGPEGRTFKTQIAALKNAEAVGTLEAQLVNPATPPSSPSSPNTKRNVILGVIVGLVLGLLLAALWDRLDRRISDPEEFERIYGLPLLAEIPRTRELSRGELTFEVAERFRALRTGLRYVNFNQDLRSLLIASPLPEDGKSTVARSLARTMAAMGDRVVLVELDLHKQGTDGGDGAGGLSTVLIGDELDDALITEDVSSQEDGTSRRLVILPAGPTPPNPSELIDSGRMREVLTELEHRFDMVLLDAPALSSVSDGLTLIPAVSGILIVAALEHTTIKAAVGLRQQIAMLRGHPVGLVVNFTRRQRRGKYYSYDH